MCLPCLTFKTTRVNVFLSLVLAGSAVSGPVRGQCPFEMVLASDGAASDQFGTSVSISGDTAVVGAVWGPGSTASDGAAYVYVRTGGSGSGWTQQAKLIADDSESDMIDFGRA